MPILEAIVVIGIVVVLLRVVPPMLKERAERRRLRDDRRHRLETAKTAEDVIAVLRVDRDLAQAVKDKLNEKKN